MQYMRLANWRKIVSLSKLLDLPKPPKDLYVRREFDADIFSECVAVVGSRRMTSYGKRVIEMLVPQLVRAGKTIVSGFMYGVDQYAHQVCVDCGGKTIAVLGWGITHPLEDYDATLAQQIIDTGGTLLSEWEFQKPMLWTFPVRNWLVAGLSHDVYVIEAAHKSGSLLTAHAALAMKRTVYATPGPITYPTCQGTNELLSSGRARMWNGSFPMKHSTHNRFRR